MKGSSHLSKFDAHERSQQTLEYVLAQQANAKLNINQGPKVSIADARGGAAHYEVSSKRETTRLLIISQETSLLNQTTQSLDGYLNLADVFDEVHIVVLQTGIQTRNPVLRVAPNMWLYVASGTTWFKTILAAKNTLENQLEFADGFRADLIVARDPLACGLLALWAGRKFKRPAQLHVLSDYVQVAAFKNFAYPRLSHWLCRYCFKHFKSIRTSTDTIAQMLKNMYPQTSDVATLPRFHDFSTLMAQESSFNIKDKYRQFSFIILYVGTLHHGGRAFQAIDAARNLMRSPKVGLVMLGDGQARAELQKRAAVLGIPQQVVFEKSTDDVASYLKSADVLLIPDTDDASDELALKGAAAGIPLVLAKTQQRLDLFTSEQSALFFADNDILEMSDQMKKVLNDLGVRSELKQNARTVIESKLHEDPLQYKLSYRDSVEAALFPEDSESAVA